MYRPLPDCVTVGQSIIEGLGLHATKDIPSNTVLGIAHVADPNFPHGFIRTGLGAFYNHSEFPNCVVFDGFWQHMQVKYLMTSRDIAGGEELTARYTLYNPAELQQRRS